MPATKTPYVATEPSSSSTPRGLRLPGRRLRRGATILGLIVILALAAFVAGSLRGSLNPFHEQDTDRSTTPLLVQLQNVARFQAATGTFQVLVDVEHDTTNLPSVISGERTTLFATGTVDASVDLSALGADRVTMSPDRRGVTITLPAPTLGAAAIDPARSRVVGRQRGLMQRVDDALSDNPVDDSELYTLAGQKLEAAAKQSDLLARGEQSTRAMLTGLGNSMGFTQVTITFDAADAR